MNRACISLAFQLNVVLPEFGSADVRNVRLALQQ